jgi:hypothetical protein
MVRERFERLDAVGEQSAPIGRLAFPGKTPQGEVLLTAGEHIYNVPRYKVARSATESRV